MQGIHRHSCTRSFQSRAAGVVRLYAGLRAHVQIFSSPARSFALKMACENVMSARLVFFHWG